MLRYCGERNRRPPAQPFFFFFFLATIDPLLPVLVMTELLKYYRRESMGSTVNQFRSKL